MDQTVFGPFRSSPLTSDLLRIVDQFLFSRLHRSSWVQSGEPPSNNELVRKRMYRIGLNLFNKKPEKGLSFLIKHSFVADSPNVIANFLVTRKGRVVKWPENQIVIAKNRNCEKLLKIVIFSFWI